MPIKKYPGLVMVVQPYRSWMDPKSYFDFAGIRDRRNYLASIGLLVVALLCLLIGGGMLTLAVNFFFFLINYSFIVFGVALVWNWCLISLTVQRLRHMGIHNTFHNVIAVIITMLLPILVLLWMAWPGAMVYNRD